MRGWAFLKVPYTDMKRLGIYKGYEIPFEKIKVNIIHKGEKGTESEIR